MSWYQAEQGEQRLHQWPCFGWASRPGKADSPNLCTLQTCTAAPRSSLQLWRQGKCPAFPLETLPHCARISLGHLAGHPTKWQRQQKHAKRAGPHNVAHVQAKPVDAKAISKPKGRSACSKQAARMSAVCTAWPALICIRPGGTQLSLSCISDYFDGMTPGLKSTTPAGTSQFISQMPRIHSSHAAPLQLHEHAVISGNIWQISLLEVAGCGELLRGQHLAKND